MPLLEPELTFAFEARVEIAEPVQVTHGPDEELRFIPITGGTVTGPRLNGEVLPYGGDWATTRRGETELDARYLVRADDGGIIDVHNRGIGYVSPEAMERLRAGEPLDETNFYFRTSPVFRTGAPAHAWLTSTVFIGMARREDGMVCIRFFALS
ncbi:DUF3237 domain-containing protein [Frankia nepalensis]|uniref:UPF0311 protein I7412_20235 n=1 Tax=Frankia nepalensis TaxID=1836974 RepID=A0A937RN30_9ACTN|nr:DUF3237 domain-containing protein [Frankia nepalensis]MBL7629453.1 DUF3237 domain-containing protein [Frankia nepalensis]